MLNKHLPPALYPCPFFPPWEGLGPSGLVVSSVRAARGLAALTHALPTPKYVRCQHVFIELKFLSLQNILPVCQDRYKQRAFFRLLKGFLT